MKCKHIVGRSKRGSSRSHLFAWGFVSMTGALFCRLYQQATLNDAMMMAVQNGNSEQVKRLLHQGVNPNMIMEGGDTLLDIADTEASNVQSRLRFTTHHAQVAQTPSVINHGEKQPLTEEWKKRREVCFWLRQAGPRY